MAGAEVASWRLSVFTLLTICLGALPGGQSEGTERKLGVAHTVSQSYKLLVHDSGNVDVVMLIDFHLQPGAVLSGSYKSILSETGLQSIEGGRVTATDAAGRGLPLKTSERDGWIRVDFSFSEPIHGTVTPNYAVNLTYTVVNGICLGSPRFHRFSLPWAHRWASTVMESNFEIEFANPDMEFIMDTVCLGASGFSLKCGHELLTIKRKRASYKATGRPHGVFFEWSGLRDKPDRRQCADYRQAASGAADVFGKSADSDYIPEVGQGNQAITVGVVSVGSSCLFAVFMCACALKMPLRMKVVEDKRLSDSSSDSTDDSLMTIGTGENVERRPNPLDMNVVSNDSQLQRRQGAHLHPDVEAPSERYPSAAFAAAKADNGAGVWSLATPERSVVHPVSWDVENEFPSEATDEEKFGFSVDDVGFPPRQERVPGIRELCNSPPSIPPLVPESQLRSYSSAPSPLVEDDWQAMSEFGADDFSDRGAILQQSGAVVTMSAGSETWEVMEEFSDMEPSAQCKASVGLAL